MPQRRSPHGYPGVWRRIFNALTILAGFVVAAPLGLALAIFMILLWPHELVLRRRAPGSTAL